MNYELTKWAAFSDELMAIKLAAPASAEVVGTAKRLVQHGPLGAAVQKWTAPAAAKLHPGVLEHLTEGAALPHLGPKGLNVTRGAQQFAQGQL